jgi:hypothetical protein
MRGCSVRRTARRIVRCCAACPAGIISTAAYDVDVPFMQLDGLLQNRFLTKMIPTQHPDLPI